MIKVTKYNKVYAVSEQEIEKQIYIFSNELKMNEMGEYTGLVAGEAVTQEDIDKEISKLKDRIEKLKAHDNDLIASLFVWTKEDAERVRKEQERLGIADLFEDDEEETFSVPVEQLNKRGIRL